MIEYINLGTRPWGGPVNRNFDALNEGKSNIIHDHPTGFTTPPFSRLGSGRHNLWVRAASGNMPALLDLGWSRPDSEAGVFEQYRIQMRSAAMPATLAWATPTMQNGWGRNVAGMGVLFTRDAGSHSVYLRGAVVAPEEGIDTDLPIFTLPQGHRPANTIIFGTSSAKREPLSIIIESNGNVRVAPGQENISSPGLTGAWVAVSCTFNGEV